MGLRRSWDEPPPRGETATTGRAATASAQTGGGAGRRQALTCLDLFCGCGGFTFGMERAGFCTLAAVDVDPVAVTTFRCNFPHVATVLQRDLATLHPAELDELLWGRRWRSSSAARPVRASRTPDGATARTTVAGSKMTPAATFTGRFSTTWNTFGRGCL